MHVHHEGFKSTLAVRLVIEVHREERLLLARLEVVPPARTGSQGKGLPLETDRAHFCARCKPTAASH
jgi:hypothetical protein